MSQVPSGTNGSEFSCRDGTKTRWRLQWMQWQLYGHYSARNRFYTPLTPIGRFRGLPWRTRISNQRQGSKPRTRQNAIFVIFSSSLLPFLFFCFFFFFFAHTKRKKLLVIGAFSTLITAKLERAPLYFWTLGSTGSQLDAILLLLNNY